jgi:hypothetical protein
MLNGKSTVLITNPRFDNELNFINKDYFIYFEHV